MVHQAVQQLGVVSERAADQLGDRHLGVLGFPFDRCLHQQQSRAEQRIPVTCADLGPAHQTGRDVFVLDCGEHRPSLAVPGRCRISTNPAS
jgi:hypothetical protein